MNRTVRSVNLWHCAAGRRHASDQPEDVRHQAEVVLDGHYDRVRPVAPVGPVLTDTQPGIASMYRNAGLVIRRS